MACTDFAQLHTAFDHVYKYHDTHDDCANYHAAVNDYVQITLHQLGMLQCTVTDPAHSTSTSQQYYPQCNKAGASTQYHQSSAWACDMAPNCRNAFQETDRL